MITHAQADHEGAALELLRRVPTRLVVNGGAGWPTAVQRGLSPADKADRPTAVENGDAPPKHERLTRMRVRC